MDTFKELLGTDNKKKQVERIQELLLKEATPEITLQIRYNGINDEVMVEMTGGDVPFDVIHRMLALTSIAIRREELNMARLQAQDNGKDPEAEE